MFSFLHPLWILTCIIRWRKIKPNFYICFDGLLFYSSAFIPIWISDLLGNYGAKKPQMLWYVGLVMNKMGSRSEWLTRARLETSYHHTTLYRQLVHSLDCCILIKHILINSGYHICVPKSVLRRRSFVHDMKSEVTASRSRCYTLVTGFGLCTQSLGFGFFGANESKASWAIHIFNFFTIFKVIFVVVSKFRIVHCFRQKSIK